jgi:5-methylcytosine-specific restriction endonuclease McrA
MHREVPERVWKMVFRADALTAQEGKCSLCLSPLRQRDATADHIVPRSVGGKTSRNNIAAACNGCNLAKGSMTLGQFKRRIKAPQPGDPIELWLVWSFRRISLATERACARILVAAR